MKNKSNTKKSVYDDYYDVDENEDEFIAHLKKEIKLARKKISSNPVKRRVKVKIIVKKLS
jgi:hypothetical protein